MKTPLTNEGFIKIRKASEHNLKAIDIDIPRNQLVVITGLSGSGKSSLAFDTIYAEGQRRYIESLSTYARQFLDQISKPDIESIEGLTPTIAIEQRAGQPTPRSTIATTTEIYDYLRVFFARAGEPLCYICRSPIRSQSNEEIVLRIQEMPVGTKIQILSPLVRGRKGEHKDILRHIQKEGFNRIRVDGLIYSLEESPVLDKNFKHDIQAVIDRIILRPDSASRITDSVEIALKLSNGMAMVLYQTPKSDQEQEELYSEKFACPEHGPVLSELSPRAFSFNSPFGACLRCNGLGYLPEPDPKLIIPDQDLSLEEGAIAAWKRCGSGLKAFYPNSILWLSKKFNFSPDSSWNKLSEATQKNILYGNDFYEGIIPNLMRRFRSTESEKQKSRIHEFMSSQICGDCHGERLKPEMLHVFINKKNISEITSFTIEAAKDFFDNMSLDLEKEQIAEPIKKAISERLSFLINVGLGYLNLNRTTKSLSGGEAQRIRLAGQVGSKLAGVTYVLDEPTIGLHQKDNDRLLSTLRALKESGNTVIVVEHDEDVIRQADYLIDIGPGSGEFGGEIIAKGTPEEVKQTNTLTADYLNARKNIPLPVKRRKPKKGKQISLIGCSENNLQKIYTSFPIGLFICLTGVSGSGKSTLVNECLYKGVHKTIHRSRMTPGNYEKLEGAEHIDKIINIDQSPIGRTSRSNPATYTGVFDNIRKLFALTPESKIRGYQAGRFSFNVKGGRCEACQGQGTKTIEMHFLPDVYVICELCQGQRYNHETLQIKYKGKDIAKILNMPIEEAVDFFSVHESIHRGLQTLLDVGLGYIRLGQTSTTLSGGEAQRIKLASELGRRATGKTLYIMDEPTTGLHFHDIAKLLLVMQRLVDQGNTLVVIEHNLDVIKTADWIIDLGPEGGSKGGQIIAFGPPEAIVKMKESYTGQYLKEKIFLQKNKSNNSATR